MIKLLGCAMVLVGCTSMGLLEGNRRRRVLRMTQDLIQGLEVLERELDLNKSHLPDMLRRSACGRRYDLVGQVFLLCAQEVEKGNDFTHAWCEGLEKINVGGPELELLRGLSVILGRYDEQGQAQSVGRVRAELEHQLERSRQEVRDKCRLYAALGGAAGGFMCIVLI